MPPLETPVAVGGQVRLVAATLPGFGGLPFPGGFDATMEAYAELAAALASDLGCDGTTTSA